LRQPVLGVSIYSLFDSQHATECGVRLATRNRSLAGGKDMRFIFVKICLKAFIKRHGAAVNS
jgi:hypothetical protein